MGTPLAFSMAIMVVPSVLAVIVVARTSVVVSTARSFIAASTPISRAFVVALGSKVALVAWG